MRGAYEIGDFMELCFLVWELIFNAHFAIRRVVRQIVRKKVHLESVMNLNTMGVWQPYRDKCSSMTKNIQNPSLKASF